MISNVAALQKQHACLINFSLGNSQRSLPIKFAFPKGNMTSTIFLEISNEIACSPLQFSIEPGRTRPGFCKNSSKQCAFKIYCCMSSNWSKVHYVCRWFSLPSLVSQVLSQASILKSQASAHVSQISLAKQLNSATEWSRRRANMVNRLHIHYPQKIVRVELQIDGVCNQPALGGNYTAHCEKRVMTTRRKISLGGRRWKVSASQQQHHEKRSYLSFSHSGSH